MARGRRGGEINIFNFSFLDILACTVGALAFTLVMVVIVNVGSLPLDMVLRMEEMGEDLAEKDAEVKQWQVEREDYVRLRGIVDELEEARGRLEEERAEAEVEISRLSGQLAVAEDMVDALTTGTGESEALQGENQDLVEQLAQARARSETLDREMAARQAEIDALAVDLAQAQAGGRKTRLPFWVWLLVLVVALMGLFFTWLVVRSYRQAKKMRKMGYEPRFVPVSKIEGLPK